MFYNCLKCHFYLSLHPSVLASIVALHSLWRILHCHKSQFIGSDYRTIASSLLPQLVTLQNNIQ